MRIFDLRSTYTIIIDPDDLERFLLANNPNFMQAIEEADRRIAETGGIKHEDLWALVDAAYSQE